MKLKLFKRILPGALLLVLVGRAAPAGASLLRAVETAVPVSREKPNLPVDPVFDEIASFLAGLPCATSPYKEFQEAAGYKEYRAALDASWKKMESGRLRPITDWAATELAGAVEGTTTLFYPFGGPDVPTAVALFPNASRYYLLGLEFVGRMPEFTAEKSGDAARYIQDLSASLDDFFKKSYFITMNMNEELAGDKVDGILPLLCFFLKRGGNRISSITRLEFTEQGELLESPYPGEPKKRRRPFGVRVAFFAEGAAALRELTYISCDLADAAFRQETPLSLYLHALPFETTFIKSASYLMHFREFSRIRALILDRSRFILQDDTGIPYRRFPPAQWDLQLYGEYIEPIADFTGVDQPELKTAYADPARVKPLPFHLGYHWGTNKDSLLYLVKK